MIKNIMLAFTFLFVIFMIPIQASPLACQTVQGTVTISGGAPSGWTANGPLSDWPINVYYNYGTVEDPDYQMTNYSTITDAEGDYIVYLYSAPSGHYLIRPETNQGYDPPSTFALTLNKKGFRHTIPAPGCGNIEDVDFVADFLYY
jgi:hypothetical protein